MFDIRTWWRRRPRSESADGLEVAGGSRQLKERQPDQGQIDNRTASDRDALSQLWSVNTHSFIEKNEIFVPHIFQL